MKDRELELAMLNAVANAAEKLHAEMLKLGYGLSDSKPLPGTFDGLTTALENLAAIRR